MKYVFENKSGADEEFLEDEIEDILDSITEDIKFEESVPHLLSVGRFKQMEAAHRIALKLAEKNNGSVSYETNELSVSMGSISIKAKNLVIPTSVFRILFQLSGNFDYYIVDGDKVMFTMAFHNLATSI